MGAQPQGVAAADFNHDGMVDLAVAATGATALDVLYGGSGGHLHTDARSAPVASLNVVAVADMNADGWLDIAAAATSTNVVVTVQGQRVRFLRGGSPCGRVFASRPRVRRFQPGRPARLAVSNYGSGTVTVLLGRRDGSVLPDDWGDLPSGAGARGVADRRLQSRRPAGCCGRVPIAGAFSAREHDAVRRAGIELRRQAHRSLLRALSGRGFQRERQAGPRDQLHAAAR